MTGKNMEITAFLTKIVKILKPLRNKIRNEISRF